MWKLKNRLQRLIRVILPVISLLAGATAGAQNVVIQPNDLHIRYMGRMEPPTQKKAIISWTASNVTFRFTGGSVKAVLDDEFGKNYYNVILDDSIANVLHLRQGQQEYILANGLQPGAHQLVLFKRTEASMGKTTIFSFLLEADGHLLKPPPAPVKKIEFYGNSITCGYADEDLAKKGSDGDPAFENAYLTYVSLTARHFDADYRCITKSGIGITVSWFPLLMPEMYDRLYYDDPARKWDFSEYRPDIVVVNLLQNDSWLVTKTDHPEFKRRFHNTPPEPAYLIDRYASFIQKIASRYPAAKIICALGNMDATRAGSPWPGYIQKAVDRLNNKNLYTCFFPFKNTSGHPDIKEQKMMSDMLIAFIRNNFKW